VTGRDTRDGYRIFAVGDINAFFGLIAPWRGCSFCSPAGRADLSPTKEVEIKAGACARIGIIT
jgi:hypothetical protein